MRYDIKHKWETGNWAVIDTKNRDMDTGHQFPTREEALTHALKMDKGRA